MTSAGIGTSTQDLRRIIFQYVRLRKKYFPCIYSLLIRNWLLQMFGLPLCLWCCFLHILAQIHRNPICNLFYNQHLFQWIFLYVLLLRCCCLLEHIQHYTSILSELNYHCLCDLVWQCIPHFSCSFFYFTLSNALQKRDCIEGSFSVSAFYSMDEITLQLVRLDPMTFLYATDKRFALPLTAPFFGLLSNGFHMVNHWI